MVVIAFSGWSDAAQAASDAADHLVSLYSGEVVATVDPDDYYDFQTSRPLVSLTEDGERVISWPTTEVLLCHLPMRDVVVIRGPEPNFRWPSFAAALSAIVAVVDPELVIVLGALLSENPHSRPVPVSLSSSDVTLRERFGAERSTYEGPTGMQGVMAQACHLAGIPTVSVWAACPHYVASPPNPKATLALLSHLEDLLGGPIDLGDPPRGPRCGNAASTSKLGRPRRRRVHREPDARDAHGSRSRCHRRFPAVPGVAYRPFDKLERSTLRSGHAQWAKRAQAHVRSCRNNSYSANSNEDPGAASSRRNSRPASRSHL